METKVLTGRMSISLEGASAHWVEPSSVRIRPKSGESIKITFRLYNASDDPWVFSLEKVAPYDESIQDAGECVSLLAQSVKIEGKTEGTFLVQVECKGVSGESWIRITTNEPGSLQSALVIRLRLG